MVDAVFPLKDLLELLLIKLVQQLHGAPQVFEGGIGHLIQRFAALLQRQRRIFQKTLVQQRFFHLLVIGTALFPDGGNHCFFQQGRTGGQQDGGRYFIYGVDNGDAHAGGGSRHEAQSHQSVDQIEGDHQQQRACQIEVQINKGCALAVDVGADGRQQHRYAGTDAHTQHHGNCHFIADDAGNR